MTEGPVLGVFIAVGTAFMGFASTAWGTVLAAGSSDLGPWAQVGGTATAVGALAYVAKLLADGKLVAQPVAEIVKHGEDRERRLEELLQDSKEREDALRLMLVQRGQR